MKKHMNKKVLLLRNVKTENNNVAPARVIKVYQHYALSYRSLACDSKLNTAKWVQFSLWPLMLHIMEISNVSEDSSLPCA